MTIHPAHEAFSSRPVFCQLEMFLGLLDAYDLQERHRILGPIYQQFLRADTIRLRPGMTEEDGMELAYKHLRELLVTISGTVPYAFIITGVVATTLAWLYGSSDETFETEFLKNNRIGIEQDKKRFERGEIDKSELDRRTREHEERINNLRSDMKLRRDEYVRFCEHVVAKLPDGRR